MLTLFHAPRSRSTRMIWLLEELGADYQIKTVDIFRRITGAGARDPANPHPAGQVPALLHDGELVTESAAIALYLTDLYPAAGVGPVVGEPGRGAYLSWLAYYAGVLEPVITNHWKNLQNKADDADDKAAYEALDARLLSTLKAGPYILGERFSAADILFASLLLFARQMLPAHSEYDAWLDRLKARPAFQRAMAKDGADG